eukprot:12670154-Alexandrium_andersonii.AAC.1
MSASLVGSEMCIRDREFVVQLVGCQLRGGIPDGLVEGQGRLVPHLQPVSYTHLTLPTICSV